MGVIIRQGFKSTIASYTGMLLGMLNLVFLYPKFLDEDQFGLTRVLFDTSTLFLSFAMLGTGTIINRYFPWFRDEEQKNNGFLFFVLAYPTVGFTLFAVVFFLAKGLYLEAYAEKSPLLVEYYYFLPLMMAFMVYQKVFENYCRAYKRTFPPAMVREVGVKILNAAVVLLYAYDVVNFYEFLWLLAAVYGVASLVLFVYVKQQGWLFLRPNFRRVNRKMVQAMASYGFWTLLGGLGTILAFRVDSLMIPAYIDLEAVAIYSVALGITRLIEFPRNNLVQIAIPIVAEQVKNDDRTGLAELYRKSALNMLIVAAMMFLILWTNLVDFYTLIPKNEVYEAGRWVALIIMLSRVLENTTGVANEIVLYSNLYRYYIYLMAILAAVNIGLNALLIPAFGLEGAALATGAAILISSGFRYLLILRRFRVQPFSRKMLPVLLIAAAIYGVVYGLLPPAGQGWLQFSWLEHKLATVGLILFRGGIVAGLYVLLLYRSRLSADFNGLVDTLLDRLRGLVGYRK